MNRIKAIAIDDEPLALRVIETHAKDIPFLDLVCLTTKVLEGLSIVQNSQIDLVFLDIQMPDLTGIQFMKLIEKKVKVILITAYPQYALTGYDYEIVDYLLKPFSYDRFLIASQKAYKQIEILSRIKNSPIETISSQSSFIPSIDFIFIKTDYRLLKVKFNSVLFIEGGREYITIHTDTEKILSLSSLTKIQESLPYPNFMRVHKSYVVALGKIDTIEKRTIYIQGHAIPIGDSYKDDFMNKISSL
jgi:two-component system, LytTR family, response regulator